MYYEKSYIKRYYRTTKKGERKGFNQINLGQESEFQEGSEVIIVSSEIVDKLEAISDLESTIKSLKEENKQNVKNHVEEVKNIKHEYENKISNIEKEVSSTKEKISDLEHTIEENQIELKEKNIKIEELNLKLNNEKDYSKALLICLNDFTSRSLINRIRNTIPISYKKVTEIKEKENTFIDD